MKKASACDKIVSHPRLKKGNQKELKMKKKYLFYVTGFFSGLSVMAIELGASRLMAPYFSSSQIIWTIIIGTIMIAMALGNILGGKMADKSENPDRLFTWIFAAATWTMLIPLLGKFVISGVAVVLALFCDKELSHLGGACFLHTRFRLSASCARHGNTESCEIRRFQP